MIMNAKKKNYQDLFWGGQNLPIVPTSWKEIDFCYNFGHCIVCM